MTEFGYSVFAGRPEVEIAGALFHADVVGTFLTAGGKKAYIYGYEPNYLQDELKCSWGNLMMLQLHRHHDSLYRLSTYHSARFLSHEWMQPANGTHEVYRVKIEPDNPVVSTYALHRPDGQWSLLAINKDPIRTVRFHPEFHFSNIDTPQKLTCRVAMIQFSGRQYRWHDDGPEGRPSRSNPPVQTWRQASTSYELPPYSLSVIRGQIANE
jgi:hypothetical protein